VRSLGKSARVPGSWCTLRLAVQRPGLAGVPPGVTAVRHRRRHGCYGAVALGKRVGLGVVRSGQATGVLGLDGGAAGGEKSLAGARGRRSPVPLSLTMGARLSGVTRGWEPDQAARAMGRVCSQAGPVTYEIHFIFIILPQILDDVWKM
jgi:hypothetical protein